MSTIVEEPKYSNFVRSGYEVLKLFNTEKPVSTEQALETLLKSKTRILLGARVTLEDYLHSLACGNELKYQPSARGYIITKGGVRELERLRGVIEKADRKILVETR